MAEIMKWIIGRQLTVCEAVSSNAMAVGVATGSITAIVA